MRGNDESVVPAKAGTQRLWLAAAFATLLFGCTAPYNTYGPYWPIVPPDLPPPRLVMSDAGGQTVDVVRTQWLIVRLPDDDARSGNRWSYEVGKDRVLYPSGDTPRPAPTTGGPSTETEFVFRAEGTGTTSLRFVYRNPDQPQAPPAKTLAFDVVAR